MNLKKEKSTALHAAKQASKVLLQHYGKKGSVRQKPNKSLVAKADIEANKAIIKIIKKNFPNHSILSEESGFEDNSSDYKWVIDPLDGTHNFLRKIPVFGTSIALEYKNEVVLGVMHFPVLCTTAVAEKGKGAFLNGKKIKVSNKKNLDHALILIDFAYQSRKESIKILEKSIRKTFDVRNFGSAVYNLLLVACGKSDGFAILKTNEWDVAAGILIVGESGGKITDLHGRKWNFHDNKYLISNGKIHSRLLKYFK